MIEKLKSFYSSFNEDFCLQLEARLGMAFANSKDDELIHFWCDGISWAPFIRDEDNWKYLNYENIRKSRKIATIAWLGITGQDQYELTIMIGEQALKKYSYGESIIDCIPEAETTEWVAIDTENGAITVRLK